MNTLVRWLSAALLAGALAAMALWAALRFPDVEVPARGDWQIPGVTVVNPGSGRAGDRTLVVRGERLVEIRPLRIDDVPTPGAEDLAGSYALPGLVDMHAHHPGDPGGLGLDTLFDLLHLAHGVTTVRDTGVQLGDRAEPLLALRAHIAQGRGAGPRVFTCGPILDGHPPFIDFFRTVADAAALRAAIDELAALGVDCVKTYHHLPGGLLSVAREAAAAHGLPLLAHLPADLPLEGAAGVDLQHFVGVLGPAPILRHADMWRGWDAADDAALDRVVAVSSRAGVAHTPTLVQYVGMLGLFDAHARDEAGARLLHRLFRGVVWSVEHGPSKWRELERRDLDALARAIPRMRELVRRLHRAGVPIRVGSDVIMPWLVPGRSLHGELAQIVAAGLSPEEAIALATRGAAEGLGRKDLGSLASGALADVAFFRQDPTRDLAALESLAGVLADGRYYSRKRLDAAVAAQRAHHEGWLHDRITSSGARFLFRDPAD